MIHWRLLLSVLPFALAPSLRTFAQGDEGDGYPDMGQMDPNLGLPKNIRATAVQSDVKYIQCEVCRRAVTALYRQSSALRVKLAATAPGKFSEESVQQVADKVCDSHTEEGDWIAKIDLVEKYPITTKKGKGGKKKNTKRKGGRLVLNDMNAFGKCKSECATIEEACRRVMDEVEADITGPLYMDKYAKKLSDLRDEVCGPDGEFGDFCGTTPTLPSNRKKGPPFEAQTEEERNMVVTLNNMNSVNRENGMPSMSMYRREDIEKATSQFDEEYGLAEEEGTDEKEEL